MGALAYAASVLGMDVNAKGHIGVSPSCGNTYLWLEDYPFTLFIPPCVDDYPFSRDIPPHDDYKIYALWVAYDHGAGEEININGETLSSLCEWGNKLNEWYRSRELGEHHE